MVLVTDIGNTRTKVAVFEDDKCIFQTAFTIEDSEEYFEKIFKSHPKIQHWVLSTVKNTQFDAISIPKNVQKHIINHESDFPFVNKYKTPKTLGIDRMVLASGATLIFKNTNRLVIDAGTCITYDWVNSNNEYLGGAIAPGLYMRYKSLHAFTDRLPLLEAQYPENEIGNSTSESIHSGIVNGIVAEIEFYKRLIETKNENFTIILTGGDSDFLAKRFKNTIFANSNFLLECLYRTFQYKINND